MVSPFQIIAEKLGELGFYNFFLPWMITTAVIWGLLKKSKLFNNIAVESVISLSVSFFLWGYLGTAGSDLGIPLSRFFTQVSLLIIMLVFGLVGASMFYPDFMGSLGHFFKENASMLTMFLLIGFIIFLMSGLLKPIANLFPSGDVGTLIIALVLFFIGIIIAANVGGPQSG